MMFRHLLPLALLATLTARYEISGEELRLYDATTPPSRLTFRWAPR